MKPVTILCPLALLVAFSAMGDPPAVNTGFLNQALSVGGATHRYVLYVPADYTLDRDWPLIVFLHGAGERGDDGLIQTEVGLGGALRRYPDRFPAIVLFPQCPKNAFWDAAVPLIEAAMAKTEAEYKIDTTRRYLTGLSMGGYMTWIWGALKTEVFAALAPICGGGNLLDIQMLTKTKSSIDFGKLEDRVPRLVDVPIWAFHGGKDEVVPPMRSRQMVRMIEEAGGKVRYTEFPDAGHNSWDAAYQDADFPKWLFKQQLKPDKKRR